MCAIGGILWRKPEDTLADPTVLRKMSAAMAHRGPDGEGFHQDSRIWLLHRLLRIFDTKTLPGPYASRDGRWVLSFNGEIYNHRELSAYLESRLPEGLGRLHSDAETLLEGWAIEGPDFLHRVNGMFAFALWDRREKRLTLGRDRLGEKPLYYFQDRERFIFASEVKALKAAAVPMRLNRESLRDYFAYRYVPGPKTLFLGIQKLLPGHLLNIGEDFSPTLTRYWAPPLRQNSQRSTPTERELSALLEDSHQLRTQSAWTPSVFLSGGVDSATIASFLPKQSLSFTFLSPMTIPESEDAKQIANRFGLDHREVKPEHPLGEIVDQAIWALEEPLGDSIILPTWSLAKAASESTKVVLSGEGADEVFAGYVHHFLYQKMNHLRRMLPSSGWAVGSWLLRRVPQKVLERVTPYPAALGSEARLRMLKTFAGLAEGKLNVSELTTLFPSYAQGSSRLKQEAALEDLHGLIRLDQQTWLPDYTLHRLDKILMSFGVEGRLPFLDHRIVELAAQCESGELIRRNQRKWLLRKSMEDRLGSEVAWRKKKPFILNLSEEPGGELRKRGVAALHALKDRGLIEADLDPLTKDPAGFLSSKKLFALDALETWIRAYEVEV